MIIEIFIFLLAAICGIVITGFAAHMFVGGLVSAETEQLIIAAACITVACAIAYMTWDVVKRRTNK